MVDWVAVLNSNLADLLIAAALGVGLASFVQWLQGYLDKIERTKRTAQALGLEIASISVLAKESLEKQKDHFSIFKKSFGVYTEIYPSNVETSNPYHMITYRIGDVNLPRVIYDRPLVDLALFTPALAATISELYNWVNISFSLKLRANDLVARLRDMMDKNGDIRIGVSSDTVFARAGQVREATQEYLDCLQRVVKMSQLALDDILKVSKIEMVEIKGVNDLEHVSTSDRKY
jgi:hypothetical protein